MSTKVYDPSEVSIVFGAIPINTGFGENSMIKVTMNSPLFVKKSGVDGQQTRTKRMDRSASVEITLMQTAEVNGALSAQANLDRTQPNGAGIVPFMLRDRSGTLLLTADEAWIAAEPDIEMGLDPTERVWKFDLAVVERFDGGS